MEREPYEMLDTDVFVQTLWNTTITIDNKNKSDQITLWSGGSNFTANYGCYFSLNISPDLFLELKYIYIQLPHEERLGHGVSECVVDNIKAQNYNDLYRYSMKALSS